jgi:hypothetical protein
LGEGHSEVFLKNCSVESCHFFNSQSSMLKHRSFGRKNIWYSCCCLILGNHGGGGIYTVKATHISYNLTGPISTNPFLQKNLFNMIFSLSWLTNKKVLNICYAFGMMEDLLYLLQVLFLYLAYYYSSFRKNQWIFKFCGHLSCLFTHIMQNMCLFFSPLANKCIETNKQFCSC